MKVAVSTQQLPKEANNSDPRSVLGLLMVGGKVLASRMSNGVVVQFLQTLSIYKNQHIFPSHSKKLCTSAGQLLRVRMQHGEKSH